MKPKSGIESSNQSAAPVEELIRLAQNGDEVALGGLLDHHRAFLKILAQRHIQGKLAVRVDASDLAQKTCLSAFKNFDKFAGKKVDEFVAWLRRVHEQNIQNEVRDHAGAQKRAISREKGLIDNAEVERQPLNEPTPSQRAMQNESAVELARALETLPIDQGEAVRLRHLEGWSLAQIAETMDRSEAATVGLIKRGMQKLRQYFENRPK